MEKKRKKPEEVVEISEKGKWTYAFSFTLFLNCLNELGTQVNA